MNIFVGNDFDLSYEESTGVRYLLALPMSVLCFSVPVMTCRVTKSKCAS